MVGSRLRELMLAAEGAGELDGDAVRRGNAEHPVCGDRVQLSVRFEGDAIADLRWLATGCPASMAVAALAARTLVGQAESTWPDALRAAIEAYGGLTATERHAEGLVLRALAAARAS